MQTFQRVVVHVRRSTSISTCPSSHHSDKWQMGIVQIDPVTNIKILPKNKVINFLGV
jgi:hypothetical protein